MNPATAREQSWHYYCGDHGGYFEYSYFCVWESDPDYESVESAWSSWNFFGCCDSEHDDDDSHLLDYWRDSLSTKQFHRRPTSQPCYVVVRDV
jgi:hypothetical protein